MLFALALATLDAPSFDCAKASTTVERMICADPELAAVDRAVSRLHAGTSRKDRARLLFTSQVDWLRERDRCNNRTCLLTAYDERLFDLFAVSRTRVLSFERTTGSGSLSLLPAGNGWYAFKVVGLWIGSPSGPVNDTIAYGHFKLAGGKAELPADEGCGWRMERLASDRWRFTELLPDKADVVGCGGLNATATGVYARLGGNRKAQ